MSDRGIRCGESDAALTHVGMAQSSSALFRAPARCRSEAPTGRTGQRSSPRACSRLAMRDLAARRAAVPGFALPRDADREVGVPVPALFRRWRYAVSLRVAQRCRVSRSRAMPVGGPPPGELASAPVPALFRGWRSAISLRVAQRCRVSRSRAMPVGGPHRENWPALQSSRFFVVGDTRPRCASSSGAGFRAPARCRSEAPTGENWPALPVPALFRGGRYATSLRVEQRCRVSRSRAMPVGDRRSAFSPLAMRDLAARRAAVPGFALPRDAGRRPALRFFAVGDARSRGASSSSAGFRAPARCRSETGAPSPALVRGWRCAISRRVAQQCRVSRSRAMPVGDRRSSPRACSQLAIRDLAARRAAVPGFALPRDAGRRPALLRD